MAESKVKRDNHLVIQGWMLTDYGLKGNELLIYACIYGFSQLENQVFTGSRQYLADWTNSTKQGVDKCLKSLCTKGLLERKEYTFNGMKMVDYKAVGGGQQSCPGANEVAQGGQQSCPGANEVAQGGQQSCQGVANKVAQGGQQSCHNNIDNNIDSKDRENIDNTGAPAPLPSHPPDEKPKGRKPAIDAEAIFRKYTQDEKTLSLLRDWMKVRKAKRAPETEKALTLNLEKLDKLARESGLTVPLYLEQVIMRGWAAFYPLNNWGRQAPARPIVKTEAEHAAGGHASGIGW